MTPEQAAEQIQSRFIKDDDDNIIGCRTRYMSDILGSDWASGMQIDDSMPAKDFYALVKSRAARKYGQLPF